MQVAESLDELHAALAALRAGGRPVHLVPTMGNLHEGHLALIDRVRFDRAAVLASIFVNPTQFGPGEDFERYPRTFERDCEQLAERGCDLVWAPATGTMYPHGPADSFRVKVPKSLGDCLCGRNRPGHFDGVAGVVLRLFIQTRPDRAVFGEKDYQQLLIIRRLVEDFSLNVEILGAPTVRDQRGLALSSRNQYLNDAQLDKAAGLNRVLTGLAGQAAAGAGTFGELERSGLQRLETLGFRPDYLEFRAAADLGVPDGKNDRVFAAAWLGQARLIDNVAVSTQSRPE